jgi:predicted transcriptional regulator
MKKRDRLEIIEDILSVIRDRKGSAKPTHILYKSNLSHQMLVEYLSELMARGFVFEKIDRKKRKTYDISEKGYKYLEEYGKIRSFVDSYGLN